MRDIITYINEDKYNDYIDKATQLFIDIVNEYVDWDSAKQYDGSYALRFDSIITENDLKDIYKEIAKHKNVIATHEYNYDWSENKYLIVNIFKKGQFKIVLDKKENKYYVYLMNRAKAYYEKNNI